MLLIIRVDDFIQIKHRHLEKYHQINITKAYHD